MRHRALYAPRASTLVLLVLLIGTAVAGHARTGNLYGTVVDNQGQPLPGVTVTITGSNGPPQIQITNAQGELRFLGLDSGRYQLKAELEGFSTVDYPNLVIADHRNTTIAVTLVPEVEDEVLIPGKPLLDARKVLAGNNVTLAELEKIPSARDPWAILQQARGVAINGFNMSSTVGDSGTGAEMLTGKHFEMKTTLDDGTLQGIFLEDIGTGIEPFTFNKSLDNFANLGVDAVARIDPGVVAGNPALCPDGRGIFQDLTNFELQPFNVDDTNFLDLPPAIDTGGFPNSVFTGGHQTSVICAGETIYFFGEEGTPGGTPTPSCPNPFFSSSQAGIHEIQGNEQVSYRVFKDYLRISGPGCSDRPVPTSGAVDTGAVKGFLWRDFDEPEGSAFDFIGVNGNFPRSFKLDPAFDQVLVSFDFENLPDVGVARANLPFGDLEIYADGMNVGGTGFDIAPIYVLTPDGVEPIAPQVANEILTTSLSSLGDSAYLIGNFAIDAGGSPVHGERAAAAAATIAPAIVPLAGCVDNGRTFCGLDNRFSVKVDWQLPADTQHAGHARPLSGDTGTFWFLNQGNRELLVKTLNGCSITGYYWFFAAGLTDLPIDISVQDTYTHRGRHYSSTGTFKPILDTSAFQCSAAEIAAAKAAPPDALERLIAPSVRPAAPSGAPCGGGPLDICLKNNRFRVSVTWDRASGERGDGTGGRLTADSGVFWFFTPNNYELAAKVIDACTYNQRYWFFAAGLTNVGVRITVTDTKTGKQKSYRRQPGPPFVPITDTNAFATCP